MSATNLSVTSPPAGSDGSVVITYDQPAPGTKIDKAPKKTLTTGADKITVKFKFSSPVAGATFECRVDKKKFKACTSPKKVKLTVGKHKFQVRAVVDGLADATPATAKVKVQPKRK